MRTPFKVYGLYFIMGGIGAGHMFQFSASEQFANFENESTPFAVVELFTSEGCSSCPPAEKYLNDLVAEAREQNRKIYPLAFHVDYWNNLGWKDEFSDSRFSERQRDYARSAGSGQVYTPQMIVNGEVAFVGSNRKQGEAAITKALQRPAEYTLQLQAGRDAKTGKVTVAFQISPVRPQGVLHVALAERGLRREIRGGENSGRVLYHDNVVRAFETVELKNATRGEVVLPVPHNLAFGNSSVMAYVQDRKNGRILGAANIDF
jgi:hypothetical protein